MLNADHARASQPRIPLKSSGAYASQKLKSLSSPSKYPFSRANVITSGAVSVEVVEKQLVGGALENYPDTPVSIMPGSAVSKIVSVKNLDEPAWVRMAYTVTIRDASGNVVELSAQQRDQIITIDTDTANWTYKDGWWYCNKALVTGEESKPLFTEVTFSGPEMGNTYQNCTVMIDVTAQAVQKVHNGDSVLDAAGWPVG